jgi:hypothetical protein
MRHVMASVGQTCAPYCLAGHVRLELRNVGANYPFETAHRFAGIQPNSGHRDYSRLSCGVEDTQLDPTARMARRRDSVQPRSRGARSVIALTTALA